MACLQGRGRGARRGGGGGGAGGFDPGLWEQRRGDGGGGRHGDLDELVALDQPNESFETVERRLSVSLLPQQALPQVHALLQQQETEEQLPVRYNRYTGTPSISMWAASWSLIWGHVLRATDQVLKSGITRCSVPSAWMERGFYQGWLLRGQWYNALKCHQRAVCSVNSWGQWAMKQKRGVLNTVEPFFHSSEGDSSLKCFVF